MITLSSGTVAALLGVLMAVGCAFVAIMPRGTLDSLAQSRRWRVALLCFLSFSAVVATVSYYRADMDRVWQTVDGYDALHYYVNSKYFDELGYLHLYDCALAADVESDEPLWTGLVTTVRRQSDYELVFRGNLRDDGIYEQCRNRFSADRWHAFRSDVAAIGSLIPSGSAEALFHDHGFNATPFWLLAGQPLAEAVDVSQVRWLTKIDLFFMVAAVLAIGWGYGYSVACVAALLFSVSWFTSWPVLGTSILRFDWLATVILSVVLIRKEHFALAGAFAAFAIASRGFPVILSAALVIKVLSDYLTSASSALLPARYMRYFGVLAGTLGLLVIGVIAVFGWDIFTSYATKMTLHVQPEHTVPTRPGLAVVFSYLGELRLEQLVANGGWLAKSEAIAAADMPLKILALLIAGGGLWMLRGQADEAAFVYGTALCFFALSPPSFYYWSILLLPAIWHSGRIMDSRHAAGLAMLFVIAVLVPMVDAALGIRYISVAWLSLAMLIYFLWLLIAIYARDRLRPME